MKCRVGIILFFISLLLVTSLHAQTRIFEIVSSKHGLSQNSVTSILEDKEGYMWFGTRAGLNRYDGYNFTLYEHNSADPASISDNNIRSICQDRYGIIWVATQAGLNAYEPRTETFTPYLHKPDDTSSISDNDILSVFEDHTGTIWIGSRFGLSKFNRQTKTFTLFQHEPHIPGNIWLYNAIHTISEDGFGNLWVGTSQGLSLFDRKKQTFTRYKHLNEDSTLNNQVGAIYADKQGFLWIGTMGSGLRKMNIHTKEAFTYKQSAQSAHTINNNIIRCIKEDSFGNIWIGTHLGGLNKLNKSKNTFEFFTSNPNDPIALTDNIIISLYEDKAKRLWIGTNSGGVAKLDRTGTKFTLFKNQINNLNSLIDNNVGALHEDTKGNLWIGNRKGLDKYHIESGTFKHYMYGSQFSGELNKNIAVKIIEDKRGNLWIGLFGGGLLKFDPNTEKFTRYMPDPAKSNSLSHSEILSLLEDAQGLLWISTRNGLNSLNPDTEKFTHYITTAPDKDNIFRITSMHEDSSGILWLATTSHGLVSFDKKSTFVKYIDATPGSLINEKVHIVMKGSSGVLWLASERGGLHYFNRKTRTFHRVTKPASLSKIVINAMVEDGNGNLWLSTQHNGICRYSVKEKTLRFYDADDGLQSNEFGIAFCQNKQGEIYFGGVNGFNKFHPQNIQDNPYAPIVKITGFKVFDKPQKLKNHTVVLPYSSNFFSFDFTGVGFTQSHKNEYAYRLDGFDEEWIYTGTRKYASYTNLDPGEYTFRVKAANNDKVWGKQEARVRVKISPPFWKTWWFIAGIILSTAFMAYMAYKARVRSIQRDNEKLERLVLERTEELKRQSFIIAHQRDELQHKNSQLEEALRKAEAQQAEAVSQRRKAEEANKFKTELLGIAVHDLKNPIGCFMLYADLIKDATTDKARVKKLAEVIKNTSHYMFTLISDLLHTVRLESGQVSLKKEKQPISTLVEEMVERNQVQATWKQQQIQVNTKGKCTAMVDVGMIKEVLENLISNAIKFTPRGKSIYVDVSKRESFIQIKIEDEGVGLSEDEMDKLFGVFQKLSARPTEGEPSSGLGLSIVKKLVELHNGRVRAESKGLGNGSIFIVELPAISTSPKRITSDNAASKDTTHS